VNFAPKRGDLIWISFSPQVGHEQAGRRPAVVLSPLSYNRKVGLAIVCPITSQVKGLRFEVAIPAGMNISGVILSDQVKNVDWRGRQAEFAGTLPDDVIEDVLAKLNSLLGD